MAQHRARRQEGSSFSASYADRERALRDERRPLETNEELGLARFDCADDLQSGMHITYLYNNIHLGVLISTYSIVITSIIHTALPISRDTLAYFRAACLQRKAAAARRLILLWYASPPPEPVMRYPYEE